MAGDGEHKMKGSWACVTGASSGIGRHAAYGRHMFPCCWCRAGAGAGRVWDLGHECCFGALDVADPGVPSGKAIALALAGEGINLKLVGRSTDKLQKVVVPEFSPAHCYGCHASMTGRQKCVRRWLMSASRKAPQRPSRTLWTCPAARTPLSSARSWRCCSKSDDAAAYAAMLLTIALFMQHAAECCSPLETLNMGYGRLQSV